MVDSIHIRNFRSFKDVRVDDCRTVNVIVGDNGSGKTALLEALFLALGVSPELALRTRAWRGYELGQLSGTPEVVEEALWSDLFYRFDTSKSAYVSLKGGGGHTRSVTVRLQPEGIQRIIPPSRKKPGTPPTTVRERSTIEFNWTIPPYGEHRIIPKWIGDKLSFDPIPRQHVKGSFFVANRIIAGQEVSARFSELSRQFQEGQFIERFHGLFKNIIDMGIEVEAGVPMLFATVGTLPRKIPLTLASGGMSKLAAILLAITEQSGGLVLIDEIENGFFHDRLPAVWKAVLDFARENKCQIFASTHSLECLRAAAQLADENPSDFSLMRAVMGDDGTRIRRFEGEKFAHAVLDNVEVR